LGFFDSLWGWADNEPKDWSEADYKTANEGRGEGVASFFARFWGWADYEAKDWSNAPNKREHSPRRSSISHGWFG